MRNAEIFMRHCYLAHEWNLYRAVDKEGKTVDFLLSEKRNEPAARAFFEKAIGSNGMPDKVTMDKSGANKPYLTELDLSHLDIAITVY